MDLDGTLIDSDITNFKLLHSLLKKYHYDDKIVVIMEGLAKGIHYDEIMKMIKMPIKIRNKMEKDMTELLKKQRYKLLAGVKNTLKALNKKGFKLAIATDNYHDITVNFLRLNDF